MKRKINLFLIVLYILIFFNVASVSALTCSDVSNEINNYEKVVSEINKTDCSNVKDEKIVNNCNKNYQLKSASIANLYNYKVYLNNKKINCPVQIEKINKIMDDNKNECGSIYGDLLTKATKYFMTIFYIIGPILTILFSSLDFSKAIVATDQKQFKKATTGFFRRIIALLLLFVSPELVNLFISFNNSNYNLYGDAISCKTKHIIAQKETKILVSEANTKTKSSKKKSKKGMIAGEYDGFMIRTTKPTMADSEYYNPKLGNTGQCVWYVRGRTIEILSTVNGLSNKERKKGIDTINVGAGESAYMFWTTNTYKGYFGYDSDINNPKEGAIIVFNQAPNHKHGHVAMVEKVNRDSSGKVVSIDYTEGWTNTGSCPNSNMSCVQFQYRENIPLKNVKINQMNEPFLGYIYILD